MRRGLKRMTKDRSRKALLTVTNFNLRTDMKFSRLHLFTLFFVHILVSANISNAQNSILTDAEGLLAFKAAADSRGLLSQSWTGTNPCGDNARPPWLGIGCNDRGRVAFINLASRELSGTFAGNTLSRLNELRYLTLSNNSLTGSFPDDMENVKGLIQLWSHHTQFSGPFPNFLVSAKRIVKVDLSGNNLAGPIPDLSSLPVLIALNLSNNNFTGGIPSLSSNLSNLDLSGNSLTGEIPSTLAQRFANTSFAKNAGLCGPPLTAPCALGLGFTPPASPNGEFKAPERKTHRRRLSRTVIILIVMADILVVILLTLILFKYCSRKDSKEIDMKLANKVSAVNNGNLQFTPLTTIPETESSKLIFFDDSEQKYDLEELLRASAEMLGKGSFGTSFKALLESGLIVAVKRLREVKVMGKKDFEFQMERLGKLRHPNLVALRTFYFAKDEKLLVYDYMPNGSLFSLLHGKRGPGRMALNWASRLQMALSIAKGLTYLHHECAIEKMPHGNLKSSNILLGKDFEACISDFGLTPLMAPNIAAQRMAGYRSPEYNCTKKISLKADVYSFGVLLLELLTGRQPLQSFQGNGIDLPKWVNAVVREEWTGEVFDLELRSDRHNEEEMVTLLQIAMSCVTSDPDHRPDMTDLVAQIEGIRQDFTNPKLLAYVSRMDESFEELSSDDIPHAGLEESLDYSHYLISPDGTFNL